jgi:glycosyltransferase involved in cell wall biosynthesis
MVVINNKKPRILFVHHTAMWYRRPFFRELSQLYNVKFLFTNVEGYNKTYNTEFSHNIPDMDGTNYYIVPNHLGIAWGALKKSMGEYDIFIGGSWDTFTDLLETMFYFTIVKLRRKPFIIWREDWDWKVHSLKRRLVKFIAGLIGRHSDAILVPGIKHQEFFTKLGVSQDKIFIMPNISNITLKDQDFENQKIIKNKLSLKNEKVVLFVGRLIDLKGVQFLLLSIQKLIEKMDNVVLLIVGDGEYRQNLEKMAHELGIENKVIFTGNVNYDLLGAYYMLSNIFVLPSITTFYADACPLVVNEAMYFGKPVITSDAVGTTFMIKNGVNGFVVPEKNSDALFNAIYQVLSDSNLEKKMGKNSKNMIQRNYKYKNMIEGFNNAIEYVSK